MKMAGMIGVLVGMAIAVVSVEMQAEMVQHKNLSYLGCHGQERSALE
jgi:hypothetical protein